MKDENHTHPGLNGLKTMKNGFKQSLTSASRRLLRLPVAKRLAGRYLAKTCNTVFIHFVGDNVPPHYLGFAPPRGDTASLASDLRQLGKRFRFVPLQEATSKGRGDMARPRLAFTIDDGMDFYTDDIVDLFRQHGIRPYLFLVTKYIGNTDLMWRHKLTAIVEHTSATQLQIGIKETWPGDEPPMNPFELLRASFRLPYHRIEDFTRELWEACSLPPLNEYINQYRPYLTWERIGALQNEGFQFGSHSHSHPAFDLLDRDETLAEMMISRQTLEYRLGKQDFYFAYPFGRLPQRKARPEIHRSGGYRGYFGTFGFSRTSGEPGAFYHRISIDGSIDSIEFAPLYPAAALYKRIRGRYNPRI